MFILVLSHRSERTPLSQKLELEFGLRSECLDKLIPLDVFFRVFRFYKASFNALSSSFVKF